MQTVFNNNRNLDKAKVQFCKILVIRSSLLLCKTLLQRYIFCIEERVRERQKQVMREDVVFCYYLRHVGFELHTVPLYCSSVLTLFMYVLYMFYMFPW